MPPRVPEQDEGYHWRNQASCQNMDTELFFRDGYGAKYEAQIEAAKAFCGMCAVREACLDYAIGTREEHGIWGGTTPDERRVIRRSSRTK